MFEHLLAKHRTIAKRHTPERVATRLDIAGRKQRADLAASGERAERRNVTDNRREPAGDRFDECVAASFVMAAEHENVCSAVKRRHSIVWNRPDEPHPPREFG